MQMVRIWWDRSIGHSNDNIKKNERERQIERGKESWLQGYKTVSMPNLTEHEIFIMLKMLAFLHLLAE